MHHELSIREAQKLVDKWIHEYGVRYFSELTNNGRYSVGSDVLGKPNGRRPYSGTAKEFRQENHPRQRQTQAKQKANAGGKTYKYRRVTIAKQRRSIIINKL